LRPRPGEMLGFGRVVVSLKRAGFV